MPPKRATKHLTWLVSPALSASLFLRRACGRFALPALITATLTIDLFGIGSSTRLQSEEAVLRLTAPWYTAPAQQAVTAVLIDEDFVAHDPADDTARGTWPMPYARYADLIEQLVPMQPRAIMLDVTFQWPHADPRDRIVPLIEALQAAADNGIPVVIGRAADPAGKPGHLFCSGHDVFTELPVVGPLERAVRASNGILRFATVSSFGCQPYYPLVVGSGLTSPAYELAKIMCDGPNRAKACGPPLHDRITAVSGEEPEPMLIRWGAFPSAERIGRGVIGERGDCDATQGTIRNTGLEMLIRDLRSSLNQAFEHGAWRGKRLRCHYIEEVFASTLNQVLQTNENLVRDRAVLIGVDPSVVWDVAPNPLNGGVPGVIQHAAATENLIGLGRRYVTPLNETTVALIDIALVFAAIFLYERMARRLKRQDRVRKKIKSRIETSGRVIGILLSASIAFIIQPHPMMLLFVVTTLLLWTVIEPTSLLIASLCSLGGVAVTLALLHIGVGPANWIGVLLAVVSHAVKEGDPRYHAK